MKNSPKQQIDLRHIHEKNDEPVVEMGMDLSGFYLSVEWDIMAVPARRKVIFYRYWFSFDLISKNSIFFQFFKL